MPLYIDPFDTPDDFNNSNEQNRELVIDFVLKEFEKFWKENNSLSFIQAANLFAKGKK